MALCQSSCSSAYQQAKNCLVLCQCLWKELATCFFMFFDMVHRAPCPMIIGTHHEKVEQNMTNYKLLNSILKCASFIGISHPDGKFCVSFHRTLSVLATTVQKIVDTHH